MKTKPQVAALPWHATGALVTSKGGDEIAWIDGSVGVEQAYTDAAFLVRAVNNHDMLRLAIFNVMGLIGNWHDPSHAKAMAILTEAFEQSKGDPS